MWVEVLEHGCLEEALRVHDLSENFQRACCLAVRRRLTGLRCRLSRGASLLRAKLKDSPVVGQVRLSVLKTLVLLRYLITEVNLLFGTVWSYSEHIEGWIFLSPLLLPVISEFDNLFLSSMDLDTRREELTTFNMRMLLNTYHEFLRNYDNELAERLFDMTGIQNFETDALDILLTCPSINCQLSLSRVLEDNRFYDISAFFGFHNLKPVFQVPDVHNSVLTNETKKIVILRYLRECVQWENLTFLQSFISDINDLEFRVGLVGIDEDLRYELILNLCDKYEIIQETPYPILYRHVYLNQRESDKLLIENYCRFASYNANMTGLCVFINISDQPPENLPLIIHNFRGQFRPLFDERILDSDGGCPPIHDCNTNLKDLRHSLQLCINYREGFNSCPAESIIDVVYDRQNKCHISSNYIESEPFLQFNLDMDTDGMG